jgi:hypothetical protein
MLAAVAAAALTVPSTAGAYLKRGIDKFGPSTSGAAVGLALFRSGCGTAADQAIGSEGRIIGNALSDLALTQLGLELPPFFRFSIAGAGETDDIAGAWRLTGGSFCVTNQANLPQGQASGFVKAMEIVRAQTALDSAASKSKTANCPAGKSRISGGASLAYSGTNVGLSESGSQAATLPGWQAAAREVDATATNWRLVAVAICANVSTETNTADYAGATSWEESTTLLTSAAQVSKTLSCPPGKSIVGGGARAIGVLGEPAPRDVALTSSGPTGSSSTSTGWTATARETDPTGGTWRLVVTAVCAPLNAGPPS